MQWGKGPVGDLGQAAAGQVQAGQLPEAEKGGVLQPAQRIVGQAELAQLGRQPQRRRGDGPEAVVAQVQTHQVVEAAEAGGRYGGDVGAGEDNLLQVDQPGTQAEEISPWPCGSIALFINNICIVHIVLGLNCYVCEPNSTVL